MGNYREETRKLKVISECFVKPTVNLGNEASKTPIHMGIPDLFMLTMDTMQKGLLFDTKLQPNTLNKIEKSLYISLVHFYPLAGRLATQKFHDEHDCSFYVDCEAGTGATLVHASVDYTVSDILSSVDVHPIVESFFELGEKSVNHDGHTRPLLSVQVTELVDGVFIGFTMNHCIADGTSLWHFISTLSEIFFQINDKNEKDNALTLEAVQKISISKKPIIETLFPQKGNGPIFKLPYLEPEEFISRYDPGPLRVRIFCFSPESISILKAKANEECGPHNSISSFQALCAFMWQSITRARNLKPDDEVHCGIVINARAIFNPPFPPEYFRCFLTGTQSSSKVSDLINKGLGRSALLINQSIKSHDEKAYRGLIKIFEEHPMVVQAGPGTIYYRPNNIKIGGSSRFDMYGPEFGLGKAVAVLAGYASKEDGKVTANPGRQGGGSVDLEVCLKPETMNVLELDEEFMSFVSSI
ncbi:putative acetyltransferase At3g50280 [Silene latifolia]|uniref:putative acetyltransferase At3g50280 n=1 Tax=Silene latifolia TaxID=37657 RepID=UPI003D777A61